MSNSHPVFLFPGKGPATPWNWGFVLPITVLNVLGEEKCVLILPGFEPETIQPVA
jgi:hypothetical protein